MEQGGTSELVQGATLVQLDTFRDPRGTLAAGEVHAGLRFVVRRFFVITGVPAGAERANHAHRTSDELLVATSGGCTVDVDDGRQVETYRLDSTSVALDVPPGHWLTCRDFTPDAALMVLASTDYDPADSITDRAEFLALVAGSR